MTGRKVSCTPRRTSMIASVAESLVQRTGFRAAPGSAALLRERIIGRPNGPRRTRSSALLNVPAAHALDCRGPGAACPPAEYRFLGGVPGRTSPKGTCEAGQAGRGCLCPPFGCRGQAAPEELSRAAPGTAALLRDDSAAACGRERAPRRAQAEIATPPQAASRNDQGRRSLRAKVCTYHRPGGHSAAATHVVRGGWGQLVPNRGFRGQVAPKEVIRRAAPGTAALLRDDSAAARRREKKATH
jgi:hypothetical protein